MHRVAALARPLLHPARHVGEERVADVDHRQADRAAVPGSQLKRPSSWRTKPSSLMAGSTRPGAAATFSGRLSTLDTVRARLRPSPRLP